MGLEIPKVPVGSKYQLIILNTETSIPEFFYVKTEKEMLEMRDKYLKDDKYKVHVSRLN